MIPDLQAQLRQAIEQASAQLTELSQDAEGDTQVAIQVANTWLSELEAEGSVTLGVEAQADALQDPAARAWMKGWMAQGKDALPHLQKLHALGREYAALGLADRQVRALRQSDPQGAVSLGDAVLAWPWSVLCGPQLATLEVTVSETALIGGRSDGATRMREALHRSHLQGHWRASFQGAMALSMAAEQSKLYPRAVELAHNARSLAVQNQDAQRYLVAMQRLMQLAETGGDRVQAYEIALRAGVSVEALLGAKGRQMRDEILAGLELRWGSEAYAQVQGLFLAKQGSAPN